MFSDSAERGCQLVNLKKVIIIQQKLQSLAYLLLLSAFCELNIFTCLFNTDIRPPEFITCPNNAILAAMPNEEGTNHTWHEPTATDNSGDHVSIQLSEGSRGPGSYFTADSLVSYTARDSTGYTATCSFTVTVIGNAI